MRLILGLIISAALAVALPPIAHADPRCTLFEVVVTSIDSEGELHFLFNFTQILPTGEPWTATMPDSEGVLNGGELHAKITWPSSPAQSDPIVDLHLSVPGKPQKSATEASARLERMPWEALYGPELFKTGRGSTLRLGSLGYVTCVAAVTASGCGEPLKE